MLKLVTMTAAALFATSAAALAHSNEARLAEQSAMIEQGRETGAITWREGRALRKEQAAIARAKADLETDGRLSRADKRLLFKMQDEAESHIASEASDGWHRPWWLPRVGR